MRPLGGSDIPKLLEISPYGGPREVFDRVMGLEEVAWSARMGRGVVMEPVLRVLGQQHLGLAVEDRSWNAYRPDTEHDAPDYHAHPTWEFAHAQIDDLATWKGRKAVVDYKSQNRWAKGWGPDGSDVVPEPIRIQLAWEMACADRDLGLLVVGFGDDVPPPDIFNISHVVTYVVERDGFLEQHCAEVARTFWSRFVIPGIRPEKSPRKKRARKS
jgi:hypothetical protein